MEFEIEHYAELANLSLTDDERKTFPDEFASITAFAKRVEEAGKTIEYHGLAGMPCVLREDTVGTPMARCELLANAPTSRDGYFTVPPLFGDCGEQG